MTKLRRLSTVWFVAAAFVFLAQSRGARAFGDGEWTCNGMGYGYTCDIDNASEYAACSACPAEDWCPGTVWYDGHYASSGEACQGYDDNWRNGCQCQVL